MFNSDRGGRPLLYVMERGGGGATRISFGDGRYGSPAWSPRGDLIAFMVIKGGMFSIGVMRPDGSDERLMTRSNLDESPTWAPNGRVIMFSRQSRQAADDCSPSTSAATTSARCRPPRTRPIPTGRRRCPDRMIVNPDDR